MGAKTKSSALLDALTSAYHHARQFSLTFDSQQIFFSPHTGDPPVHAFAAAKLHDLGDAVIKRLIEDARFPGSSARLIRGLNGQSGFYPRFAGPALIRRALQKDSPNEAIQWLQKVLATRSAKGKEIVSLWGATVEKPIQLTPAIQIVPVDQLPDCTQKRDITDLRRGFTTLPVPPGLVFSPPTSALVASIIIEPVIVEPDGHDAFDSVEYIRIHEQLKNVALALTAVGPRAVIPGIQWFTFDDPDLNQASLLAESRSWHSIEILPRQLPEFPPVDPKVARSVVADYFDAPPSTRDTLHVALERLNQAQRRDNVGDRAVELSIAFEASLGDNDQGELKHKMRVRSARLLGGDLDKRKLCSAIVGKMYDIRSKLVHTGRASGSVKRKVGDLQITESEIIDRATVICAEVLREIMKRGSIPNWTEFDLTE